LLYGDHFNLFTRTDRYKIVFIFVLTFKTILLTYGILLVRKRAGRSVVDRSLGMGEAAGSIPAQSIHF
jgi:hypothetical protein